MNPPPRIPPQPATSATPAIAKQQPGRALDEHGKLAADEQAADTVKVRKTG